MGSRGNHFPAGIFRHKENIFGQVFVLVFLKAIPFSHQLVVFGLETVGDIFQKNESENNGLVLRSVDIAPQHTGRVPDLLFKTNAAGIWFSHDCLP